MTTLSALIVTHNQAHLKADFKVVVNLAACAGIAENSTQAAIAEMKDHGAILVSNPQDNAAFHK